MASQSSSTPSIEWPTLLVAGVIYAAFLALTWWQAVIPRWLLVPAAAYVLAWHGSLQHEATHGHPTRWPWLNEVLVSPALGLWLPFRLYLDSHLAHHRDRNLTDPLADPESYYRTPEQWRCLNRPYRLLLKANNTVAGRLLLGPWIVVVRTWAAEAHKLVRGERRAWGSWALHVLACLPVLWWVLGVCDMTLGTYLACFVYPGLALSLLRSFAEHRAAPEVGARSAIVEAAWPLALLYLNNNLHAVHHRYPLLPWYRLPALYHERRAKVLARNGGYLIHGYGRLVEAYLLRAKEPVVHPLLAAAAAAPAPIVLEPAPAAAAQRQAQT